MNIVGKGYKLSTILFVVFIVIFFISSIDLKPNEKREKYQQELIKKENWLKSELDDIDRFMNFKKSDHRYFNREVWYTSRYVSPEYDEHKLSRLYSYLIEKGWVDITSRVDKEEYIAKTSSQSEETSKYVHILCNRKSTIFMYMTDMQNDYIIDLFKARTLVELKYDYNLPCYDLNE